MPTWDGRDQSTAGCWEALQALGEGRSVAGGKVAAAADSAYATRRSTTTGTPRDGATVIARRTGRMR